LKKEREGKTDRISYIWTRSLNEKAGKVAGTRESQRRGTGRRAAFSHHCLKHLSHDS